MAQVPQHLKYTREHEWVEAVNATTIRFGITDYAQAALGDIVFVTLPHLGEDIQAGTPCGEVESTKSVSDIFAPVSGKVTAVNDSIETSPETLNQDPYKGGWIADVEVGDSASALARLLSADDYENETLD